MTPATYNLTVQRGGTLPISVRFKTVGEDDERTPMDLTGTTVVLSILWPNGSLRKTSADGGLTINLVTAEVTWAPTVSETRQIPEGQIARYEIELKTVSRQAVYMTGLINGVGGLNDD